MHLDIQRKMTSTKKKTTSKILMWNKQQNIYSINIVQIAKKVKVPKDLSKSGKK